MNVSIEAVEKRYGDVTALDGLSLEIPSGSTFGLLGTNGAGKTTLFRLLVGHETPDAGRITVGGIDVERAGERVRERVGFLPDSVGFPARLTGREVLAFHARMRGVPRSERDERIEDALTLVDMVEAAGREVSGYSNGMRRRLGLASVLVGQPAVLVLDEPTAGLDPCGVAAFHDLVERVSAETDATIVFASHALAEVERCCDRVAIVDDGRLVADGSVSDLRRASGGSVRVRIDAVDDAARASIVDRASAVGSVSTTDAGVEVECESRDATHLVTGLDPATVERIEIDDPGLGAVFLEAVGEEVSA